MSKRRSTARSASRMKRLQTKRTFLSARVADMARDPDRDQTQYLSACDELAAVNQTIQARTANRLVVTEHALLRYLQRVEGIDLEAVCQAIATPELEHAVATLGNGKYPIGNGVRVTVIDRKVVTVIEG